MYASDIAVRYGVHVIVGSKRAGEAQANFVIAYV